MSTHTHPHSYMKYDTYLEMTTSPTVCYLMQQNTAGISDLCKLL